MEFYRQKTIKRIISAIISLLFCSFPSAAQPFHTTAQQRSSKAQLLTRATDDFRQGNFEDAQSVLLQILSVEPTNVAAQTLAGAVADRQNDLTKAEKHFAAAARLDPKNPETRNNYGAILSKLNRRNEAAREFAASLSINPNQLSALVNLAQIKFTTGDFQSARQLFEKARTIAPDAEILRALIMISLELKDKIRAAKETQEYLQLTKDHPDKTITEGQVLTLAQALIANDLVDDARHELENANSAFPRNTDILILLSRVYLRQKNVAAAGKLLESAVASGFVDARIYAALADVYQAGGYFENAIPAMRLAIEKDSRNEFYRARYGLLLIDSKAPAAAIVRLKEFVREFPNSAQIWLALGMAQLTEGGNNAEAKADFERVLQIEPNSISGLAYLATVFVDQAQYAEAVKTYQRAVSLDEKNAVLHYLLADTLLKIPTSDEVKIETHLKRAIELDQTLAPAHLTLGKFYARSNRWQDAASEFEQAVKFAPVLAEGHYQLGLASARLKRAEESRRAFENYKKLNESQSARKENDRRELVRRLTNVQF